MVIPLLSIGQELEYKSFEKSKYYKKSHFKSFKLPSEREILKYKNEFFKLEDIKDFTPFHESLYDTPAQDSILDIIMNDTSWNSDKFQKLKRIGKIEMSQILKHEKKDQIEAFVYLSNKYESFNPGESGIWVAFSTDKGETWEYMYTGIVQKQPLYLKWYSKIPLIKSDTELQIESCLLRQSSDLIHPGRGPSYELVKDGHCLTLDLKTLRRDSDNDGLTDIVETKLYTNRQSNDTDGDRIPDNIDLNPRYAVERTEKTIIFESLLNKILVDNFSDSTTSTFEEPAINYATDSTETYMIITDDPDIQSIQLKSARIIILSKKEYKKHERKFRDELESISISPLFKVDNETDTYIVSIGQGYSSWEYIVKKTNNGWQLLMKSMMIS